MKTRRSNNFYNQQSNEGKKRPRRIRRRTRGAKKIPNKFDNSTASSTNSPVKKFKGKRQPKNMNRPLKRLNYNQKKNNQQQQPKTFNKRNGNQSNFIDAISEFKKIRQASKENPTASTSTANNNQENAKSFERNYQSVTVISDDDLEDGEIIESQVSHYASLIAESFTEVESSKAIVVQKSPDLTNSNRSVFYVDRSAGSGNSEVPLYNAMSDISSDALDVEDVSIVCVDSTQSDDSVICIDDEPLSKNSSQFATDKDFIALSPIVTDATKQQHLSRTRKERQKARFKSYKHLKMAKKVLALQSNGKLDEIATNVSKNTASTSQNNSKPETLQISSTEAKKLPVTPFLVPSTSAKVREKRIILIDGSNVALGFTASNVGNKAMVNNNKEFSAEALQKVILYFEKKEFQVKAVVPEYRVRRDKSSNHELMVKMYDNGKLITTPSKAYDDLILLESAAKLDAAIVSNDLFRDVRNSKQEFKTVVENRQIRYNWVFGELILAEDPNGRAGPKLDDILFKRN